MEKDNKEIMPSKLKTVLRVVNILFCVLFVFCVLFYVHLGRVISPFLSPEKLQENLNKTTGLVLNFEAPEITTTFDFCLNIKSDLIELDTPDNKELLSVKDANVKIKIQIGRAHV